MGTIKTTNIEPIADNGTVTLGSSGDTFTLGSGVVQSNMLYPAFSARMNANQTISTGTWTKANFNTEILDTNGKYDTSNYKFTPGVTGYYRISAHGYLQGTDGNLGRVAIYKNGSEYNFTHNTYPNNNYQTQQIQVVMYLDSDDYVEAYFRQDAGSDKILLGENGNENNFAGYRIGS